MTVFHLLENTLTLEVTTTAGLQFDWLVFNQISSKSVVNFKIAKLPNPNDWNWRPVDDVIKLFLEEIWKF